MNYKIVKNICLTFTLSILLLSCIPSQPPQQTSTLQSPTSQTQASLPQNQSQSPENKNQSVESTTKQENPQNATSQQSPEKSKQVLNFGDPGKGIPYTIQVTQLPNMEGYAVQGSFGLSGTITRPEKDKDLWVFAGQFEFPSDKFKLGQIDYNVINAPIEYYKEKKPLPPDFQAQVFVSIHLTIPADAKDEKGEFKAPFKIEMPLPKTSEFIVTMVSDR